MRQEIPAEKLGPWGPAMAEAVQTCVHCGFCLPTCPTYRDLQQEPDSPRGRILLMKEALEGKLPIVEALTHVDRCLGCLACETACPSGVKYGHLISPFRAHAEAERPRTLMDRLKRRLVFATLPYPGRFRWAMRFGRATRFLRGLVPGPLRPMVDMVPDSLPPPIRLATRYPASGAVKGRVALLAGCAQQVLDPEINAATIRVLNRNGIEVLVPAEQGCCGALAWHVGESERAKRAAIAMMSAMPDDVDAIVTNAAGCGSGMHEYPLLLEGTEHHERARRFAAKVKDISVVLQQFGIETPPAVRPTRVAYHDACHLAHAQGVRSAPRRLLASIPGVELVEIRDGEICCGSAGTYNIDQPAIAERLGRDKAAAVRETECDVAAAGNIGCLVQIRRQLAATGHAVPVEHPIVLLDRAYTGRSLIDGRGPDAN